MKLSTSSKLKIHTETLGEEQTPVLIVDNFIEQVDCLIEFAAQQNFFRPPGYYPGVRANASAAYQVLLIKLIRPYLKTLFNITHTQMRASQTQFSLATQAANNLHLLQRIPHFDSTQDNSLATVHYLFKQDFGGTGFYRHKKTNFERITKARLTAYLKSLESENGTENMPKKRDGYINGDTRLFSQIAKQEARFNRLLVYPQNILHSGDIPNTFVPDNRARNGRLTLNTFIDVL